MEMSSANTVANDGTYLFISVIKFPLQYDINVKTTASSDMCNRTYIEREVFRCTMVLDSMEKWWLFNTLIQNY
jgi:hypothetical protein